MQDAITEYLGGRNVPTGRLHRSNEIARMLDSGRHREAQQAMREFWRLDE
jgi:hypothetical protein